MSRRAPCHPTKANASSPRRCESIAPDDSALNDDVAEMNDLLQVVTNDPGPVLALILGPMGFLLTGFVVWIGCRVAVRNTHEREQTRREVAAYVAEGSISAVDAEKILSPSPWYASVIGIRCWGVGPSKDAHPAEV